MLYFPFKCIFHCLNFIDANLINLLKEMGCQGNSMSDYVAEKLQQV